MFDELINLVKEHAGAAITNNTAIPNEQNDAAVSEASSSIMDGLKNAVQNGNISDLTNLFNGNHTAENSPVTQGIQENFIQKLMDKFGMNSSQASGVASSLIPQVMSKLVNKTNDPNESGFNVSNILQSVTGGNGMDLGGLLSKFTGSNNNTQQASQGGGLMDELKSLL